MNHGPTHSARRPLATLLAAATLVSGLFASSLAAPATAEAQTSVIVLGVRSFEGDDEFSRNLTGALRHSASQVQGWNVSDREVTLAQMALVHGCEEITNTCMGEIASSVQAQRVLYGEVRRTNAGDDYDFSVNLYLFNAESGDIEQSLAETLPGERTDIDDVREPVQRFVSSLSGAPRVGRILVSVNVPGAEVFVDDESVGTTDGDGQLAVENVESGRRRVRVVAEGHNSFRSTVSVEAYADATFEAELQQGGGGGGGGGVPIELIVGVGLLVVAAASAGLWIWSMTEVDGVNGDPDFVDYRDNRTAMGADVCIEHGGLGDRFATNETIADLCSRGATHEILQFVFLGIAAVAGGVGAYFLATGATGGDSDTASLQLVPTLSVGQDHGVVGLAGRF